MPPHIAPHRSLLAVSLAVSLIGSGTFAKPAHADTATIDFDAYTTGSINTQDGWSSTGSTGIRNSTIAVTRPG